MPTLIKVGLAHVQFETIHPFLDGNGRLGRMLVTLMLCHDGALAEPSLYLSLYFRRRRNEYYAHLQAVRTEGDWEGWLRFFFAGVAETAREASETTRSLWSLFDEDRRRILEQGKGANTAVRIHDLLQKRPILSIPAAREALGLTHPAIGKGMHRLEQLGVVRELTGRERHRLYVYDAYLKALTAGMGDDRPRTA
jgi:Fic family protein